MKNEVEDHIFPEENIPRDIVEEFLADCAIPFAAFERFLNQRGKAKGKGVNLSEEGKIKRPYIAIGGILVKR